MSATLAVAALVAMQAPGASSRPARPETLFSKPLAFEAPNRRALRHALSSGAVAFLAPAPSSPRVELRILFRAGAYADPPGKEGLALLCGELLRGGGTATRPLEALDRELRQLGAELATSIGETEGSAVLRVGAKEMRAALAIAIDTLRNPAFDPAAIERAKQRLLADLSARDDSIDAIEARAWKRVVRGEHFSTALPSPSSVVAITREDLLAFPRSFLFPRNLVIAVSGPIEGAAMLAALEETLAGWPNSDAPLPVPPEPAAAGAPGVYLVDVGRALATARVRVGVPGIPRDDPDRAVLAAIAERLGGALYPSRADRALRVDRGLTWRARASFTPGELVPGEISVAAPAFPADASAVAKELIDEIRREGEERIASDALGTLRQALLERAHDALRDDAARVAEYARQELLGADPEELAHDRAKLEAMTPEDILRVTRRMLAPQTLRILAVGSGAALGKCEPPWASLGPVQALAP